MALKNKDKLNERQILFLSLYLDPNSETFGNAYRSAIKAGYSSEYADNISGQGNKWLSENVGDAQRLINAEKALDECLTLDTEVKEIVNEKGEVVTLKDPQLLKIKQDTAKFISERLGKAKYSTRTELTGADGKQLLPDQIQIIEDECH